MYSVMSFFIAGHQKSFTTAHVVFEIPGCPAVGESWYREITPLFKEVSSMTTNQSPYQYKSPVCFKGYVTAHFFSRSSCRNWCKRTHLSMEESVAARENKQESVVVWTNKCGGRTVTLVLSFVPWS